MSMLDHKHPAQLVLGAVMLGEEIATKGRQMTFAILCRDAMGWAAETRDVMREIAADAAALGDEIAAAAKDGVITARERSALMRAALEIETEAKTGKIL